jgi:DNA-directed RNA polymerase subunit M/transcription elongation factor TFIIS
MHFCDTCSRVMARDTSSGKVVFVCACGAELPGAPEDACISTVAQGAEQTTALYESLIRNASKDRTNQLVARDCPQCGLDYMTQVRVGEQEIIVYTCKCGYRASNGAGSDASADAAAAPTDGMPAMPGTGEAEAEGAAAVARAAPRALGDGPVRKKPAGQK